MKKKDKLGIYLTIKLWILGVSFILLLGNLVHDTLSGWNISISIWQSTPIAGILTLILFDFLENGREW